MYMHMHHIKADVHKLGISLYIATVYCTSVNIGECLKKQLHMVYHR